MKKHLFFIIYTIVLIVSAALSALGTFVIPKDLSDAEILDSNKNDFDDELGNLGSDNPGFLTDRHYKDENIEVKITQVREYETEIYVADIKVNKVSYLKTAFAKDTFGQNIIEYTSVIAKRKNAIFAINGDYYGFRLKGYVLRNGTLYDPTREPRDKKSDILVVNQDGSFKIVKEASTTPKDLYDEKAWQVFCFGPGLISNGQITVSDKDEVGGHMESNPRTAIACVNPGHYIIVVSDGRTEESAGLSLFELATFLQKYNVSEAYNLDGGGSSVMVFNDQIINKPTTDGRIRERGISDIVYIGY
jgi:exopolysaccharide biosynthesis protein